MDTPLVSVIIPCFKRPDYLTWHLATLPRTDKVEFLVVNDGFDDDGTKEICDLHHSCRYFFTGSRNVAGEHWRCPSFASNFGVKKARGKFIILTCPEMYHFGPSLKEIVRPLITGGSLLTTPRNVYDDYFGDFKKEIESGRIPDHGTWEHYFENNVPEHPFKPNPEMPYFMGMRKERFMRIGGYDEDFTGIGADDNDLVDRLKASGLKLHNVPTDVVHVYHGVRKMDVLAEDPRYKHNCNLWRERKGIVKRNVGRKWGEG